MSQTEKKKIDVVDLHGEAVKIRLKLSMIKSIVDSLDLKMKIRFKHLKQLVEMIDVFAPSVHSAEATSKEYKNLITEILGFQKVVRNFIHKIDPSVRASRFSLGYDNLHSMISQSRYISGGNRFAFDLNIIVDILSTYQKEYHRLMEENRLLTREIIDIIHTNVGSIQEITEINAEKPEPIPYADKERISYTLKQMIMSGKYERTTSFILTEEGHFEDESLVKVDVDKSFDVDIMETRELTHEQWQVELERIRNDHIQMVANEMKLATVKALAIYGSPLN